MSDRTIIIPDIHTDHEWVESAIAALSPGRVVFLGDYFDAPGATVHSQQKTAEWLRHSIDQPNRIHLLGNHDAQYAFKVEPCSGYDARAHEAITAVLGKGWGERLHLHHWEQGRLLTHAGVHPELWPGSPAAFDALCSEAMDALRNDRRHALLNCGSDRGGAGRGGVLWLDFHWSFEPIHAVAQIVGHTRCLGNAICVGEKYILNPEVIVAPDGTENWNLDTRCASLGLLAPGGLEIIENTWRGTGSPRLNSLDAAFWDKEDL